MTQTEDVHGDVHARGAAHDHAVNVVAGGPPAWLREVLREALEWDAGAYPDEGPATEAIAARHRCDPAEVVLLNGAAQGYALIAALGPRRPAIVHPQFTEPDRALAPLAPRHVVLAAPWEIRARDVPEDADLVVVGRPVNPTGVLPAAGELRAMARGGAAERRTVVVDEAFLPFTAERSLADGGAPEGVVVLRSVTKHLAIPGLRAGYLVARAEVAERLRAARPAWSVNALALAALKAEAERGPDAELPRRTAAARTALAAQLRALGITVHDGTANFLLTEIPDAPRVIARLRTEHDIAVRPAHTFPGLSADHVRLTVRDGADDARLVAALARLL